LAGADVRRGCARGDWAGPGGGHRIQSSHSWTKQSKVRATSFFIEFNALDLRVVAPGYSVPLIVPLVRQDLQCRRVGLRASVVRGGIL
jgi:hypothetical protein